MTKTAAATVAIWYPLVAGVLTDVEIKNLRATAERVATARTSHHFGCRVARACSICDSQYLSEYELAAIADAAELVPAGRTVRYAGSLTEVHGEYVCGGLCDCFDCDGAAGRYALADAATGEIALTCVRGASVRTL